MINVIVIINVKYLKFISRGRKYVRLIDTQRNTSSETHGW